jgi:hypothetical protein
MLQYNESQDVFELPTDTYREFIQQKLKDNNQLWNETQLEIIVGTMADFMNSLFEKYKTYPGGSVELLQKMADINAIGVDMNKEFLREIIAMRKNSYPKFINEIAHQITKPYQICIKEFTYLGLNKLQQHYHITDAQKNALKKIIDELLNDAIKTIRASSQYQKAVDEGQLYYDVNQSTDIGGFIGNSELTHFTLNTPGYKL